MTNVIYPAQFAPAEPKKYYTAVDPWGREYDLECETAQAAQDFAERDYYENEHSGEAEIEIVTFIFDDNGEKQEIAREKAYIEADDYRGDYAEHNTYYKGGAI